MDPNVIGIKSDQGPIAGVWGDYVDFMAKSGQGARYFGDDHGDATVLRGQGFTYVEDAQWSLPRYGRARWPAVCSSLK